MGNHIEYGTAKEGLFTLHPRSQALEELHLQPGEVSAPWVLGLWNANGDGVALEGTRAEVLDFLTLARAHVARETDPRLELDQALKRLTATRTERAAVLEHEGDTGYGLSEIRRLDEQEVDDLADVAEAAAIVNDELYPY